jgi:hypothetical protein
MGTNYLLLTSLSQWGLFLGIGLICYAGIEKKFNLLMAGQSVFIALSLFALWILLSHQIVVPEFTGDQLPKEARTVSYFVTLSGVGLFCSCRVNYALIEDTVSTGNQCPFGFICAGPVFYGLQPATNCIIIPWQNQSILPEQFPAPALQYQR